MYINRHTFENQKQLITHNRMLQSWFKLRGYYGTVRYGITVRLDFGKKYGTELRTEFLEKVRYGNTVLYFTYRTLFVLQ